MISGYIEKIKYRNEDNGYSVLSVYSDGNEHILVGNFNYIDEGAYICAEGKIRLHPVYGEQLFVEKYELKKPDNTKSVLKYLSSGAIKGIGETLAARIVKRFGEETLRIMEEEPGRLSEIKGISDRMAMSISTQINDKKSMRDALVFLQNYGIGMALAVKIYKNYGNRIYRIIEENPYRLADDISGIGFKIADDIAKRVGIQADSKYRAVSGLIYVLSGAGSSGHTYLPMDELLARGRELLGVDKDELCTYLTDMQVDKRIVIKSFEEEQYVYLGITYFTELAVAKMLCDLNISSGGDSSAVKEEIIGLEKQNNIKLDDMQRKAVVEAINSGLMIITGGPGTGKTTTIDMIIKYFQSKGEEILLAAPTGRAAKRMTETTAYEAKTIHRLLEIKVIKDDEAEDKSWGMNFERNEEYPLEADAIIIDEMSMVDIYLMHALLKAVPVGTRLILVGDVNQLPSVGPGNVLKDIINSAVFNVVKLDKIYRQAAKSDIVVNAHKMISGEHIELGKKSRDFLFIKRDGADAVISAMLTLIRDKLPDYVGASSYEIQVMTPMRKGALGVERLNTLLQQFLNPPVLDKAEHKFDHVLYRVNDKVMQVKNNYEIEWEIRNDIGIPMEKGLGIYNGDIGVIREINEFAELITVEFDEGRVVEYRFQDVGELELAYAITIHKSQGSEYPAAVIPMYNGPRMLMTRNLIYTAVTRARSCICLVGDEEAFYNMVCNISEIKRYSGLTYLIKELKSLNV